MVKYPSLYKIVRKKNMSVAQVLSTTPLNVSFRRALVGDSWDKWLELVGNVLMVNLNNRKDSFIWTANKNFSVKNMYNDSSERRDSGELLGVESQDPFEDQNLPLVS
jgi:hypothetical protein